MPIVVGGDCTITLGVLAGLIRRSPNLGLLYFDGDVDLNTPAETSSGIFDGMVMAHIIGQGAETLTRMGSRYPLLREEEIILFGYNSDSGWMDQSETERLEGSAMVKYPVGKIRGRSEEVAREALATLERGVQRILVHFDVDVIDSVDFGAADVLHEHGLGFQEAINSLRVFASSSKFAGLVITEFNPDRDPFGTLARRFVEAVVGVLEGGYRYWEDLNQ
jgi:arginase